MKPVISRIYEKATGDPVIVPVNFRMSRHVYRAFKLYCIAHELPIGDTMAHLVAQFVQERR